MLNKVKGLIVEEQGQGMTEYGLVLGVIAIGVVGVLVIMKDKIFQLFTNANNAIDQGLNTTTP